MEYIGLLYLATRLDTISAAFGWLIGITVVMSIIGWVLTLIALDDNNYRGTDEEREAEQERDLKRIRRWRNGSMVAFFIFVFCYALTPTKKDAMFIAGGAAVIEATKAVAGSAIAKHSVSIVEEWLARELAEQKAKSAAAGQKAQQPAENKEKK